MQFILTALTNSSKGGYDADIIRNNNYPLVIKHASSEASVISRVESGEIMLFYWWTPHSLFNFVDLTRVSLRDYTCEIHSLLCTNLLSGMLCPCR